jgi:hypothetical protein
MNFQNVALDPSTLIETNFEQLLIHTDWRTTWTRIVSGKFSMSPYSGLLFYSASDGYAEFYETNGFGGIAFLQSHSDWRTSWTHIIPGIFRSQQLTGLLFYDQQAGFAAIYDTDGRGGIIKLHEFSGWRNSWTHITTVRIPGSNFSGVVLYDQAAGHGEIHRCNGHGGLELILESDGWRTSWTQVVGDPVSGLGLLFYEGSTGHGEVYPIIQSGNGEFSLGLPALQDGLPAATQIVAGNFGSWDTSFLFYDAASGQGTFVFYLPDNTTGGTLSAGPESYSWRTSWDLIIPGQFWEADPEDLKFQDGFTDLLFYNRAQGYAEFYLHEPFNSILVEPLEGYASPASVYPGGNIRFFVNTRVGSYVIRVYRQDVNQVFMTKVQNTQPFSQPYPIGRLAYRDGPAWPPAAEFIIPQDWPSGLYLARVETPSIGPGEGPSEGRSVVTKRGYSVEIPFVVRGGNPGNQSSILVILPDTTYAAYNFWGGRSLYGFRTLGMLAWSYGSTTDSPDNHQFPRAFRIALERPYNDDLGIPKWQKWEVPLIRWLSRQRIPVEWCLASDIHRDRVEHTNLLRNYRLVVSIGHDEYWSAEMRDNVEGFVAAGGNAAFFSGNVCWWQIRFDPDVRKQTCYKDVRFDPEPNSHLATVNWYDKPVCKAETSLTGVSYYNPANQFPSYSVLQRDHWVFANTGLGNGDQFGPYGDGTQTVVGNETDRYQSPQSNRCLPSSPGSFLRLAEVPAIDGQGNPIKGSVAGTMGTFTNNQGQVFTAGTINWSLGLSQDGGWSVIDQITRNVLDRLR